MSEQNLPWYKGITGYQWLVLTIASLGWVFDVFEGQIFVASMREAMPELLGVRAGYESVLKWNNLAFASFLLGGAFGGVAFGVLSDKIGRSSTMIAFGICVKFRFRLLFKIAIFCPIKKETASIT